MKTDWTLGVFFFGCALALGCPADDSDDAAGSSGVVGDDDDDDDDDGNTSMNPPTTGVTGDDTTSGPSTATTTDGETEGETESDTEGSGACEIMLPPPPDCMMQAPPDGGWRVTRLSGMWAQDGSYDPDAGLDFAEEDDPQAGGGFIGGSTDGGGETSIGFIPDPTGGPVGMECDPIAQDCPEGEKCMPWSNDGGSAWNATRCSPIDPTPVGIGESCMVEGSGVSGLDNCILGAMCWDVDPETNIGECIEMCSCSYENPICQGTNTSCVISNQQSLTICLPVCNPLDMGTCPDGQGCFPFEDLFHCANSVGMGTPQGTPCEFINACDPGQACVSADTLTDCDTSGCCADFCDLEVDDCGAGTTCTPWYQGTQAPDECLGLTGICS